MEKSWKVCQFNTSSQEVDPGIVSHAPVLGCVTCDILGYSAVYGKHALAVALAAKKGETNPWIREEMAAPSHIPFETVSM